MPLPTNMSRPVLPYVPEQVLAQGTRYVDLGTKPVPAIALDADCNWLTDMLNLLADSINNLAVGILPGADNPVNQNKFPVTDGQSHISWTLVQAVNMANAAIGTNQLANNAVSSDKLQPQSVTSTKIHNGAIGTVQIGEEALEEQHFSEACIPQNAYQPGTILGGYLVDQTITGQKIADETITSQQIAAETITSDEIAAGGIITVNLADKAVNPSKISSAGFPVNSVLTSTAGNGATFQALPLTGKILQIKSKILKGQSLISGVTDFSEFSNPLNVSITTTAPNSTILVFVSAYLVGGYSQNSHIYYPQIVYCGLFKNGVIWPAATGTPTKGGQFGGLGEAFCSDYRDLKNIMGLCSETVAAAGTTNTYSLRAFNQGGADFYIMLNSQLPDDGQKNFSGVASVSTLYALEIGA